jgi:hypothetical protein
VICSCIVVFFWSERDRRIPRCISRSTGGLVSTSISRVCVGPIPSGWFGRLGKHSSIRLLMCCMQYLSRLLLYTATFIINCKSYGLSATKAVVSTCWRRHICLANAFAYTTVLKYVLKRVSTYTYFFAMHRGLRYFFATKHS